jgi:hemerythrin-like domain-containing protein
MVTNNESRRRFLGTVVAGTGAFLASCSIQDKASAEDAPAKKDGCKQEEDVSPAEDLMREHGVLKRILLIYGEAMRRLDDKEDVPPESVADAARIIRNFIEDYHEKLEEDHLFPRFRKAGVQVELVDVLLQQHKAGRNLTDQTLRLANLQSLKNPEDRRRLSDSLRQFIRMYSPHEAREDTVLFPSLRKVFTANEYGALGEDFERKEHQLFGEDGFEKMADRVAVIEKNLGIYDLAQFTPR